MKILEKKEPWWGGLVLTCAHCKTKFELEPLASDEPSSDGLFRRSKGVKCPCCHAYVEVIRSGCTITAADPSYP